ncbi:15013_t:CDS:2 [Funneliformis caledonium]|uniref:15013_t:CDS:1 n=1 Tax=Funneliformis caledonium TaxID=1117310 RepID=A0A9N8YTF0_9GLOM|nr:15013_t:CDS:2 [Funneliformis caledonium]
MSSRSSRQRSTSSHANSSPSHSPSPTSSSIQTSSSFVNPWIKEELIAILDYINDNIADWLAHPKLLCEKAIQQNIIEQRSIQAVYQKAYNSINAMRIWLKNKKKGHESIIWSDTQVKVLLEEVTRKIIKEEIEDEREANDVESIDSEKQESSSEEKDKDINYEEDNEEEMDNKANEVMNIDDSDVFPETDPPCLPFSIPMLDEMYKIKLKDIDDMDSDESKDLAKEVLNKKYKEILEMIRNVYMKHEEIVRLIHKTENKILEFNNEDWY